jgi:hypothetical protein
LYREGAVSEQGVPAALLFFFLSGVFVVGIAALDFMLRKKYGDAGTITFGVRWLARHVPLLTHGLVFLLGMLLGGLFVHFFATPSFFWP